MFQVMKMLTTLLVFVATYAGAECPDAPDIAGDLAVLIDEARAAENDAAGGEVSGKMWRLWLMAPDAPAQELLDQGMQQRSSYDFLGAIQSFDALVDYCPEYAEGYNQRAFVYFLSGDYEKALTDLDQALVFSPDHVGAQSGRALTLMNLGQTTQAREQLLAALQNNPWLSERFLLSDGGPLAVQTEEL